MTSDHVRGVAAHVCLVQQQTVQQTNSFTLKKESIDACYLRPEAIYYHSYFINIYQY